MAGLDIASKANQATTLPALLVATYAQVSDPNARININFTEVDTLKSGNNASVGLIVGNDETLYGSQQVIETLLEANTLLNGQKGKDVCNALDIR